MWSRIRRAIGWCRYGVLLAGRRIGFRDDLDLEIAVLTELHARNQPEPFWRAVSSAWGLCYLHKGSGGTLFLLAHQIEGLFDKQGIMLSVQEMHGEIGYIGCLTQVASWMMPAQTEWLTKRIRSDPRVPRTLVNIDDPSKLHVFAEYRRLIRCGVI
jgi:hypothetical protein